MSDPRRLVDVERGRARELLLAARDVVPAPPVAVEQALQAIGSTAFAAPVPTWAIVKWLALGVCVGIVGSTLMASFQPSPEPKKPPLPSAASATGLAASTSSPTLIQPAGPTTAGASTAVVARPTSANPAAPSTTLADEVAQIDRVRAQLARGRADGALLDLDQYDAHFARPQLRPEAQLLRLRALSALGRGPAARELARRLLASDPSADYAARVREAAGLQAP
jgi:hypothetical protein